MTVKLRKKKLSGGRYSLYLDIYQNGHRSYEFLKLYLGKDKAVNRETMKLADNIRAKRQLEFQDLEHGFISKFKRNASFVEYFEHLIDTKYPLDRNWHATLKHLRDSSRIPVKFSQITTEWLEDFSTYLTTQVTKNTAHTYFSKINVALNQAVRDKIIINNPANAINRIKKDEVKREFLTAQEIQVLADSECKNREVRDAFLFACFTGLRFSDMKLLEWQNIKAGTIEYRQQKTGGVEYLHLSPMARQILSDRSNPKVVHMPKSKVFDLPSLTHTLVTIRKWTKDSGIEKHVTFHTARHTFATLALTSGTDLYTVSKLLGHKRIQTTEIYAKIVDEKKKQAMEAMPVINLI